MTLVANVLWECGMLGNTKKLEAQKDTCRSGNKK